MRRAGVLSVVATVVGGLALVSWSATPGPPGAGRPGAGRTGHRSAAGQTTDAKTTKRSALMGSGHSPTLVLAFAVAGAGGLGAVLRALVIHHVAGGDPIRSPSGRCWSTHRARCSSAS